MDLMAVCELAATGMRAWKEGKSDEAKEVFVKLRTLDANSQLWPRLLARAHFAQADHAEALKICEEVLGGEPAASCSARFADALLLRGCARLRLGDKSAALTDLERVASLGSVGGPAAQELTEALAELGVDVSKLRNRMPRPPATPAAVAPRAAATAAPRVAAPVTATAPSSGPAPASAAPKKASGPPAAVLSDVKKARGLEEKGQFMQAMKLCQDALARHADLPDAVLCLARMHLRNGNASDASRILQRKPASVLTTWPQSVEAYSLLASASEAVGDWDEASESLERAIKLTNRGTGETKPPILTLRGRLAKAKWHSGERDAATGLAQQVLDTEQAQREACEVACAVLLDRGDSAVALGVMLRCLIAHRNEPSKAQADLVCGVMRRCSVEELMHVLAPQLAKGGPGAVDQENRNSVAEVLAYVGLIMKERSEVLEACRLYSSAVLLAPRHASLCLNLMHTYTLRRDDMRAIAWGVRFLEYWKANIPAVQTLWSLLCEPGSAEAVAAAPVAKLQTSQFENLNVFYDAMAIGFAIIKMLYLAQPHQALGPSEGKVQPPWQLDLSKRKIETESVGPRQSSLVEWQGDCAPEAHLAILKGLCKVLDASRKDQNLHMTPIRNEHAYFACISDVLRTLPPSSPASSGVAGNVYVVGDSHVLSSAWKTVPLPTADGSVADHVLVPCLVTGCKIWHLRETSNFYTKYAFWDRIDSVPCGAPTLLLLGEIDCREGVVKAVQQGKQPSIEAALKTVVELYVKVLREVRKRIPRNPIFLHPVAHALPETRILTITFNQILIRQQTVLESMGVKLLEFNSVFEGEDPYASGANSVDISKLKLLPELELDGTHMSPRYVDTHLGPALADVWKDQVNKDN